MRDLVDRSRMAHARRQHEKDCEQRDDGDEGSDRQPRRRGDGEVVDEVPYPPSGREQPVVARCGFLGHKHHGRSRVPGIGASELRHIAWCAGPKMMCTSFGTTRWPVTTSVPATPCTRCGST